MSSSAQAYVLDPPSGNSYASSTNNTANGNGFADDGQGDVPSAQTQGESHGTRYYVETGSSFTFSLSLSAGCNGNGTAYAAVGSVSISTVTGYWDGPYYLHYGTYTVNSQTPTPWPNNTPTPTPEPNDVADNKNFFSFEQTANSLYDDGSITPVWYWNGPILGTFPPGYEAIEASFASIEDPSADGYPPGYVSDGQGTTQVPPAQDNGLVAYEDSDYYNVQVGSDEEPPGEGNGYVAMGQAIKMQADPSASGLSATDLMGDVSLTASIYSGFGGD